MVVVRATIFDSWKHWWAELYLFRLLSSLNKVTLTSFRLLSSLDFLSIATDADFSQEGENIFFKKKVQASERGEEKDTERK